MRTSLGFYLARKYPDRVKEKLIDLVSEELGDDYDVEKHFTPSYKPWDQRMCLVPDSDLFNSIKDGRANVVTDTIDRFTPTGILLNSGNQVEADIIVSATGIELNTLCDINVSVDGDKGRGSSQTFVQRNDVKWSPQPCFLFWLRKCFLDI